MNCSFPGSRLASVACVVVACLTVPQAFSQQPAPANVNQLVRDAVYNELHPPKTDLRFTYRDTMVTPKKTVTKQAIQTPQGDLERVVAINGRPLTADERAKEDAKLNKLVNNPEILRKKHQSEEENSKREDLMVKTLPDAFLYAYAGTERGPDGRELLHLKFTPNPSFNPPNRETQVYVGMKGDMLIDPKARRLAKIDGVLFKDVNFGWGIFGRLEPGGKFYIEQADVGQGVWQTVKQVLKFKGTILMMKSLNIDSTDTMTDFKPVSSQITTAQAVNLLQKSDEVFSENGGGVPENKQK